MLMFVTREKEIGFSQKSNMEAQKLRLCVSIISETTQIDDAGNHDLTFPWLIQKRQRYFYRQ
ncbi:hypothetical protein HanIR_Chr03g0128041 [Helianthus annuus]|nr:hypothetical protein HanIR_Chr03g0128041 [Helianthus annuus]